MINRNMWKLIAQILLIVGAINWGMVGLFDVDIISSVFGDFTGLTRLIFVVIGFAAFFRVLGLFSAKAAR